MRCVVLVHLSHFSVARTPARKLQDSGNRRVVRIFPNRTFWTIAGVCQLFRISLACLVLSVSHLDPAGNLSAGNFGDGGSGRSAMLSTPASVAMSSDTVTGGGSVFIADSAANTVRRWFFNGTITTVG